MHLAQLVLEVGRRTGLLEHESTMIRFAADRYALALGRKGSHRCWPEDYLRTPEERASLIAEKCADLDVRRRRQVLTLLNRLFSRAARVGLVEGLERAVEKAGPSPEEARPGVEYPFVLPDGSLPEGTSLEDVERALFSFVSRAALSTSASQAEAARKLGLKKSAFQNRLVKHGLYD